MKQSLVSVIIPTHNSGRLAVAAIQSVLLQSWKETEIIVVDDASTDTTVAIVNEFLNGGEANKSRVTCLSLSVNKGKNAALNRGMALARGQYVLFLDHDDTLPPESLEIGIAFLESHPDVVATYGDAQKIDFSGKPYEIRKSRTVHTAADIAGFFRNPIASSSMLMRKRVLDDIGALDESFHRIDDVNRNLQVFLRGAIAYIPSVLLNYRIFKRPGILLYRIRTMREFAVLINRYFNGAEKRTLFLKQTIFQLAKFVVEIFTHYK
jgi:glycosyltransferase involved in cell wall biosynthesis